MKPEKRPNMSTGSPSMDAAIREIDRLRAALEKFVAHYPHGINPDLDEAYRTAIDALAKAKEQT